MSICEPKKKIGHPCNYLFIKIIFLVFICFLRFSYINIYLLGMKILLKTPGIQVNAVTAKGTALHIACKQDKQKFIQSLIKHHADPSFL